MTKVDHKEFVNKLQDQTYENESKINRQTVDGLKNDIDRLDEEVSNEVSLPVSSVYAITPATTPKIIIAILRIGILTDVFSLIFI